MSQDLNFGLIRAAFAALCLSAAIGCMSGKRVMIRENSDFTVRIQQPNDAPEETTVILKDGPDAFWRALGQPGGDALLEDTLSLSIIDEKTGEPAQQPILSDYVHEANQLKLTPRFPLSAGASYAVRVTPIAVRESVGRSRRNLTVRFIVPARATPERPRIEAVYPSGDSVPANCLKFYIQFSKPMRQGEAFRRIKLLRENGEEISEPFRKVELWSPDEKQLTLWLHPGRQKRGVNLNQDFGPILESGQTCALTISGEWTSVDGAPLGMDYEKRFTVGEPKRGKIDLSQWRLLPPNPGSRQPLRIELPAALDWALLQSRLAVETGDGVEVAGSISIKSHETVWRFEPRDIWQAGRYHIVIDPSLEDLAGNTPLQPFEKDVSIPANTEPDFLQLPFRIEPSSK